MIDHCPASPQELYLDGLALILGESGLEELSRQDLEKDLLPARVVTMDKIASRLAAFADPLAAQGLSLMAGREEFSTLLRLCGEETPLLDPSIRMLPPRRRIAKGLDAMLHWLKDSWGLAFSMIEKDQSVIVSLPDVPVAEESQSPNSAYFLQGLLQGMLTWISGGKFYPAHIEQTAGGHEIVISCSPID